MLQTRRKFISTALTFFATGGIFGIEARRE
jgi:hypothetical protein